MRTLINRSPSNTLRYTRHFKRARSEWQNLSDLGVESHLLSFMISPAIDLGCGYHGSIFVAVQDNFLRNRDCGIHGFNFHGVRFVHQRSR